MDENPEILKSRQDKFGSTNGADDKAKIEERKKKFANSISLDQEIQKAHQNKSLRKEKNVNFNHLKRAKPFKRNNNYGQPYKKVKL